MIKLYVKDMTAKIQILNIGDDANDFLIYSNVNNYTTAFETNVTAKQLIDGFATDKLPNGTTSVRVTCTTDKCPVKIDIPIS